MNETSESKMFPTSESECTKMKQRTNNNEMMAKGGEMVVKWWQSRGK
jgi:hypothetical protein